MTREQLLAEARTWIGTPFHHRGRVKGAGVDCGGLVVAVAGACGIALPDLPAYARRASDDTLRAVVESAGGAPLPLAAARPGDVLLFAGPDGHPQHLGLLAGRAPDRILHACLESRRVVEQVLPAKLAARLIGVYRIPGLT
jgi:cell wall-associated NlpC family hydrolase